jgi:LPS sulfotransferase NodH
MATTHSYFICTTPRTGSFLLAEALEGIGIAGKPKEYFDPNFETHWINRLEITAETEYLPKLLQAGTTPNGVFGAKVFWFQFEHLMKKIGRLSGQGQPDIGLLDRTFPDLRYIFLVRRDKVRQAISYHKAIQTEVWWSIPGNPDTPTTPKQEPRFDYAEIERWLTFLNNQELNWYRYFEQRNLDPLLLVYEDMIEAFEPAVFAVLRYLGIPVPPGTMVPPPRLAKQADAVSEEWVRKYHWSRWSAIAV